MIPHPQRPCGGRTVLMLMILFPAWGFGGLAFSQQAEPIERIQIAPAAQALGFDPQRLGEIDRQYTDAVQAGKLIGCSALIRKNGQEVFFGCWGDRNRRSDQPMTRDTIFRIYSMTKPITTVAALQLVERGVLDLDAPVADTLPELADLKVLEQGQPVPARRPMTIRDLMRHTSGLTYGFFGNTRVDQQYRQAGVLSGDANLESTIEKLSGIPLLHQPGTRFHYGVSTDVLGRVVEVVSGQSLADYFEQHIFQPLQMENTWFMVPMDARDRFSQLYTEREEQGLVVANPWQSAKFVWLQNRMYSGGGGLCSTIDDYAVFCQMLLNDGRHRDQQILKADTIQSMMSNQLAEIQAAGGRSFEFGLGLRCFPEGDFGWGGAAGTRFFIHPEKNLTILYMTQILPDNGGKFESVIRKAAYEALESP